MYSLSSSNNNRLFGLHCGSSFDLDLPAECDDEFWENVDPSKSFVQPEGKPSYMAFHTHLLKLREILAFAARTIVSPGQKSFVNLYFINNFIVLDEEVKASIWDGGA